MNLFFLLAIFFFFAGFESQPHQPPPAHVVEREEAPKDSQNELNWIESLDSRLGKFFTDGRLLDYEKNPGGYGLGYCLGYRTRAEGIWATVYFFHSGMANLENGIESEKFQMMWNESTSARYFANSYKKMADSMDTSLEINGVPFRRFYFTGSRLDVDLQIHSYLFLTVYQGSFLKARVDFVEGYPDGTNDVAHFMDALVKDLELKRERYERLREQE